MQCRQTIKLKTTKHGYHPTVPCGQCLHCRLTTRDQWAARILLESQASITAQFVTLTFSDDGLATLEQESPRPLMRKFFNALRMKETRWGNPRPIRFFGVLERGELLDRPHIHLCLFNHLSLNLTSTPYKPGLPRPRLHTKLWPHGHVDAMPLTPKSARYCAKYVTKFETPEDRPPTVFHCQRPPLGYTGLKQHLERLSRSPASNWEQPTTINIDGKDWPLHPTLLRHFLDLSRKLGIRSVTDTFHKKQARQIENQILKDHEPWHIHKAQLDKEATRERLFAFQREAKKQRQVRALETAALLTQQSSAISPS